MNKKGYMFDLFNLICSLVIVALIFMLYFSLRCSQSEKYTIQVVKSVSYQADNWSTIKAKLIVTKYKGSCVLYKNTELYTVVSIESTNKKDIYLAMKSLDKHFKNPKENVYLQLKLLNKNVELLSDKNMLVDYSY